MTQKRLICYLVFANLAGNLFISGCGKAVSSLNSHPSEGSNVTSVPIANNSALLSGIAIGKGVTAISNLRKSISVNVLGDPLNIGIGEVFAARSSANSNLTYFMFSATNNGSRTLCFIKLNGITYKNPVGTVLAPPQTTPVDYAYIVGSVKMVLAGLSVHTCLAPKETGMLLNVDEIPFTSVASMEFSFTSTATGFEPQSKVIPYDYSYNSQNLKISVKNQGTVTALIDSASQFHVWSLMDGEQKPLLFGYVDATSQPSIAPNAVATLSDALSYDGAGSAVRVFVDFDDVLPALQKATDLGLTVQPCPPGSTPDAYQFCMIKNQMVRQNLIENGALR